MMEAPQTNQPKQKAAALQPEPNFIDLANERFGHKKKTKRDPVNGFLRSGKGLA
jgi:hypothetical protein